MKKENTFKGNRPLISHNLWLKMKITTIFIFLTCFCLQANNSYSQNAKVNLNVNNASLTDVFKEIEKQTEYRFFYNNTLLDNNKKVSVNKNQQKLSTILNELFKGSDITYKIVDKYIVLTTEEEVAAVKQDDRQTIKGVVVDEANEPIIGASIIVKGNSTIGTISDMDGAFTLAVPSGSTLAVSYIGYTTQDVPVGNKTTLRIILREDSQVLNEIIVTGYGAVAKKNLTTSIAKVKADEVPTSSVSNMSQMLMGRAAGLQATMQNAQPGGNVEISVRGGGTPVYVIDGIVMPSGSLENSAGIVPANVNRGGLAGLNPEDIESIEILKGCLCFYIWYRCSQWSCPCYH